MGSWFYILLASIFISTFSQCVESHSTPECNQLTYGLIMRRITEVTYHTHATVKDSYTKTKQYVDVYKQQTDQKLGAMDGKLNDILIKLVAIETQLGALTTGPVALSPTDVLKTARAAAAPANIDLDTSEEEN
ncbi:uncharacterized protein LOC116339274 [Contarinia nasturtii]|uniref:uncharacterized protein LOC116339274 n=1 Tax=Contarinia nasturtii TaxID=265458 RepID=UPI0012D4A277|nr:uncharacterized protein LOC116339274 [Contarinia nasturtii]